NVGWFDIAMEDIRFMSGSKGIRNTREQVDNFPYVTPLLRSPVRERAAVNKLGDQILPTVELADIINGQNVRMVQSRRHLGFSLNLPAPRRIRDGVREELDGSSAAESGVHCAVNPGHAAGTQRRLDMIRADVDSHWQPSR